MGELITLDEWGEILLEASRKIPPEKRGTFEQLMALLRAPVGELGRPGRLCKT